MSFQVGGIRSGFTQGDQICTSGAPVKTNDLPSAMYLQVNSCGVFLQLSGNTRTVRPNGRSDYQFICMLHGQLTFRIPHKIALSDGEAMLIPPCTPVEYRYGMYSDAAWVHFSGQDAASILQSHGIQPFTRCCISNPSQLRIYAEHIIREFHFPSNGSTHTRNAYLMLLLALVQQTSPNAAHSRTPDLSPALDAMGQQPAQNLPIDAYARLCKLSVSHFTHLFTEKFHISPYQYLLRIRLVQAQQLLTETNLSIQEIARHIGYEDPFAFSRIFKRRIGMSPRAFRVQTQKNVPPMQDV